MKQAEKDLLEMFEKEFEEKQRIEKKIHQNTVEHLFKPLLEQGLVHGAEKEEKK